MPGGTRLQKAGGRRLYGATTQGCTCASEPALLGLEWCQASPTCRPWHWRKQAACIAPNPHPPSRRRPTINSVNPTPHSTTPWNTLGAPSAASTYDASSMRKSHTLPNTPSAFACGREVDAGAAAPAAAASAPGEAALSAARCATGVAGASEAAAAVVAALLNVPAAAVAAGKAAATDLASVSAAACLAAAAACMSATKLPAQRSCRSFTATAGEGAFRMEAEQCWAQPESWAIADMKAVCRVKAGKHAPVCAPSPLPTTHHAQATGGREPRC